MRRPRLGLRWDSTELEWRLAALALFGFALLAAALATLWAVVLPVSWATGFSEPEIGVLWPVLNLVATVPFTWSAWRFARSARRFVGDGAAGGVAVHRFAAFYALGTVWSAIALPVYGLILPLLYAPMYLAGLGALLLLVRLARALREQRAAPT